MFAKISDVRGNIIAIVDWKVVPQQNDLYIDRFVDRQGNIYLERLHDEFINGIELIQHLMAGVEKFYHILPLGYKIISI